MKKRKEILKSRNLLHKSKPNNTLAVKRRGNDCMRIICWVVIPVVTVMLLVLDAVGIYTFNNERLIVLGITLLVALLPFFGEITVKDVTLKRGKGGS